MPRIASVTRGQRVRVVAQSETGASILHGTGDDASDAGQQDTLDIIVLRPAWRMSELADAMRVDPSTATRAVQRLAKIKLAERRTGHGDARW